MSLKAYMKDIIDSAKRSHEHRRRENVWGPLVSGGKEDVLTLALQFLGSLLI
jgi:hypothetical protein